MSSRDDVPNVAAQAGYFTASGRSSRLTLRRRRALQTAPVTIKLAGTISGFARTGDSAPLGDLELTLSGDTLSLRPRHSHVGSGHGCQGCRLSRRAAGNKLGKGRVRRSKACTGRSVDGRPGSLEQDKTTSIPTGVAGAFNATIRGASGRGGRLWRNKITLPLTRLPGGNSLPASRVFCGEIVNIPTPQTPPAGAFQGSIAQATNDTSSG